MKRTAILIVLILSACVYEGMEDLSEFSLGQYEAMRLALEEAKRSGKMALIQKPVEIRHRRCTDEQATIVKCSYELRQALDPFGNAYGEWALSKRTFKNTF